MARRYHISVSRAKKYMRCPASWYFEKVYRPRMPFTPAAWTARGIAIHNALMDWEKSDRDIDAEKIFVEEYDKKIAEFQTETPDYALWNKTPNVRLVKTDIDLRRKDGFDQIQRYIAMALDAEWEIYKDDQGPFVERDFEIDLVNPEDAGDILPIKGGIDKVIQWPDGTLQPVDLKTGNKGESNIQLGTYGFICRDEMQLPVETAFYYYCKAGSKGNNVDLSRYTRKYITKYYFAVDDDMERSHRRGFYPANPSPDTCKFCPAVDLCIEGIK